jgi:hypothetical protein
MTSFEEQTKRLERAKKQYELMLLHYSDDSIDDTTSATIYNGATTTPTALTYSQSMVGLGYRDSTPSLSEKIHRRGDPTFIPISTFHLRQS